MNTPEYINRTRHTVLCGLEFGMKLLNAAVYEMDAAVYLAEKVEVLISG
jgi:hypothetical protein